MGSEEREEIQINRQGFDRRSVKNPMEPVISMQTYVPCVNGICGPVTSMKTDITWLKKFQYIEISALFSILILLLSKVL